MMKKILILILIFTFSFSANNVQAAFLDKISSLNIMPDSPFYFLKIWYEKIVLFFTFNAEKKAEKYKDFAEGKSYEISQMIKKGRWDLVEKLRDTSQSYLEKAKEKLEKALRKAIEQKKEDLIQGLRQKLDEVMNTFIETIGL